MEFVVITDPHLSSHSNVRVDSDYCGTIISKLNYVVECANKWDAHLLCCGDLFDKPTVPEFVKSALVKCFKQLKYTPITIRDNHGCLFNNADNDYKTSLYLMNEVGILDYLRNDVRYLEEGGERVRIINQRLVKDEGIPTIILYHGFLNKEDGPNTFLFEDIPQNDYTVVCLGHDHVEYEPVQFANSTIYRIGALVRAIRNDSEQRIPKLLRIRLRDGKFYTKLYEIPCAESALIFKSKKLKAEKSLDSYDDLIKQLADSGSSDMDLFDALNLVTDSETVTYLKDVLDRLENKHFNK
nr:MAG TPA: nuclease1/DNA Complex, DNA binding protein-DNA complex [Caudoviricetes sp.]